MYTRVCWVRIGIMCLFAVSLVGQWVLILKACSDGVFVISLRVKGLNLLLYIIMVNYNIGVLECSFAVHQLFSLCVSWLNLSLYNIIN